MALCNNTVSTYLFIRSPLSSQTPAAQGLDVRNAASSLCFFAGPILLSRLVLRFPETPTNGGV